MCKLCKTQPVYEFTNKRKICKNCFIRWFEKKVLYTIRKFEMANKGDVIGYEKKKDFRSVVLEEVLKMYSKKGYVELVKLSTDKKINRIAISSTIDSESEKIIHELINGKADNLKDIAPVEKVSKPSTTPQPPTIIKPLYLFLDKEVLLYAKLKGLKFSKLKRKKDKISSFIDELEIKHPEIKRAIVRGFLD